MDYQELLNAADYNRAEARHETSVKRFNSELPPPKKISKSGVQQDGIAKFLARKKAEEEAKAAEARRRREELMAIRATNAKNNKKAKIMASRTKDNDFSKIKLTEDEIESKRKREILIIQQNLRDKKERMKARIDLEDQEKLLPRKRKRKSKNVECVENQDEDVTEQSKTVHNDTVGEKKDRTQSFHNERPSHYESSSPGKISQNRKVPKPQPPTISFAELLKVAEKKQHQPLEIVVKKKEDEKPLTKKERKLLQEEKERERRKREREKERILMSDTGSLKSKSLLMTNNANNKNFSGGKLEKSKNPVVVRLEKNLSGPSQGSAKQNISNGATSASIGKGTSFKFKDTISNVNTNRPNINKSSSNMLVKSSHVIEQRKSDKLRDVRTSETTSSGLKKSVVPKKNGVKINPISNVLPKPTAPPTPQIDVEAIEKRIREKIEKEIEEKILSKLCLNKSLDNTANVSDKKEPPIPKPNTIRNENPSLNSNKKDYDKPSQKDIERMIALKRQAEHKKKLTQKPPEKKPFHPNPYLDPPRRLLEPQIQRPPPKRRIESSDEDDEDDDMSDFIDDTPQTQNEENYSKYIKDIFGYDRNKYLDDDDDEVMESSFAQQMKEEVESTKAGIREDLEEERKEMERKKRKNKKK